MLTLARRAYLAELRLYRAHHAHPINWWLHCACVPLEWAAWLIALAQSPLSSSIWFVQPHWLVQLALSAYVLPLRLPTTGMLACAQLVLPLLVDALHASLSSVGARLGVALAVWSCSWLLQVPVGHWLVERNQPSMATKLTLNAVLLSVPLAWDFGEVSSPHGKQDRE